MNIEIKNHYNKKITKSQQKWLDDFLLKYQGRIIEVALTKGGYISVDYKRLSKDYPYGREIRGGRAGWIASLQGKGYDFDNGWILDGVSHDSVFGVKRFTLE